MAEEYKSIKIKEDVKNRLDSTSVPLKSGRVIN